MFTPDPGERASRALTAAQMKLEAGDLSAAGSLLAAADAGPLDELGQVRAQRVHAQIAFDLRRGSDAPPLLLRTAQRLEALDPELALETHLKALVAVIYAARLATDPAPADVARAALAAPLGPERSPGRQLLLLGLATRLTAGYAAAAPTLKAALRVSLAQERHLDWSWVAYSLAAMDLWDDDALFELACSQAELARATGTLILLPFALDYLATFYIQAGDLSLASGLQEEAQSLDLGVRAETLPYIPLRLAAWRGDVSSAVELVEVMIGGAHSRGEGCAVTAADYAMAILYNGLGEYELAFEAAQKAAATDEIATSSWALCELVEAAARSGRHEIARESLDQLRERTGASGTAWAKGSEARASALLEDGESAEDLHREGIETLGQSRMAADLARARLSYGEWLRRENRRVDAREQLRQAYDVFATMGADGFADRARRELLATGEQVRKRRDDTRDDLTPQEQQIARLARDGRTNPEIGAELYISPRTVEWHLRKVYAKLGVSSRKGLRDVLRRPYRGTTPV
jgi:DNA-binding CsgD family transcriptional regulator